MIDAETSKPIAVFLHHPPFEVPVGPDPINYDTPEVMTRLSETLQRSGRVIAVIGGHVHRGTGGHVGDIPATVMPSIATTLRRGDYPAAMKTRPVYHIHRFDPARGFSTETRIVEPAAASARDFRRRLAPRPLRRRCRGSAVHRLVRLHRHCRHAPLASDGTATDCQSSRNTCGAA